MTSHLRVTGHTIKTDTVYYNIEVTHKGKKFIVPLRFSEIIDFHSKLGNLGQSFNPPPRHPLYFNKIDPELLNTREGEIQVYLKELLSRPNILSHPLFLQCFEINLNERKEQSKILIASETNTELREMIKIGEVQLPMLQTQTDRIRAQESSVYPLEYMATLQNSSVYPPQTGYPSNYPAYTPPPFSNSQAYDYQQAYQALDQEGEMNGNGYPVPYPQQSQGVQASLQILPQQQPPLPPLSSLQQQQFQQPTQPDMYQQQFQQPTQPVQQYQQPPQQFQQTQQLSQQQFQQTPQQIQQLQQQQRRQSSQPDIYQQQFQQPTQPVPQYQPPQQTQFQQTPQQQFQQTPQIPQQPQQFQQTPQQSFPQAPRQQSFPSINQTQYQQTQQSPQQTFQQTPQQFQQAPQQPSFPPQPSLPQTQYQQTQQQPPQQPFQQTQQQPFQYQPIQQQPQPFQPVPTQPQPFQPVPTQPQPFQPVPTQPQYQPMQQQFQPMPSNQQNVNCPVCGKSLSHLPVNERHIHVDSCLSRVG